MYEITDPASFSQIQQLLLTTPATLSPLENTTDMICEMDGLKIKLTTSEEALILCEVFGKKDYEVHLQGPFIAFDIGMNMGAASLYLANHTQCEKVYAYEPFFSTFQRAKDNFQMNPILEKKILPNLFGLGDRNRNLEIKYCELAKGRMSIYGLPEDLANRSDLRNEKIEIRDIAEVLRPLFSAHLSEKVFMKMDCEGAEYEILPALQKSGLLSSVDEIVIEWHFRGASSIEELLLENGFVVENMSTDSVSGLIRGERPAS